MPIYTYACDACGAELERRQSFSDTPLSVCEACGGSLRRVLHPVGVIFKGSGFYTTDYKSSSNGSKAGANGASESSTDSTGSGAKKTESPKSETSSPPAGSTDSAATSGSQS